MIGSKKIANVTVAALLAIGVLGIGALAYQQKIQADTIVPGYSTAHFSLQITVPQVQSVPVKAVFTPVSGGKKYFFKDRSFSFAVPGLNTVDWYIRKIPAGAYDLTIDSNLGNFDLTATEVTLKNDQVNDVGKFVLDLGSPPATQQIITPDPNLTVPSTYTTAQPSETETATETATSSSTSTNSSILSPPVPGDPTQ
ncbi:MAG: hypothetical protein NTZ65_03635 [Candidatus Berkelbacteria bacterium]|nr:hypothetical protein [Candidatus Berkelbacteria bacterium]